MHFLIRFLTFRCRYVFGSMRCNDFKCFQMHKTFTILEGPNLNIKFQVCLMAFLTPRTKMNFNSLSVCFDLNLDLM